MHARKQQLVPEGSFRDECSGASKVRGMELFNRILTLLPFLHIGFYTAYLHSEV
jgi:hypothetical protein